MKQQHLIPYLISVSVSHFAFIQAFIELNRMKFWLVLTHTKFFVFYLFYNASEISHCIVLYRVEINYQQAPVHWVR